MKQNPFRRWNTFTEDEANKAAGARPDILAKTIVPQTTKLVFVNPPNVQKASAADRPLKPTYGHTFFSNVSTGSTFNKPVTQTSKGIAADAASCTLTNTSSPNSTTASNTATLTLADSSTAAALLGSTVAPKVTASLASATGPSASSIGVPFFGTYVPYFADAAARSLVGHPPEAIPSSCLEDLSTTEVYDMDNFGQGPSGPRVLVYSADLTRVVVDSLAVPSDGMLSTSGGLAKALLSQFDR